MVCSRKEASMGAGILLVFLTISVTVTSSDESGEGGGETPPAPKKPDEWGEEPEYEVPNYEVPKGVQTLDFNPGNLNDEDQHSRHMPKELRCDGCRAIAYSIKKKLKKIQNRYKKGHVLSEMDVIDLIDGVCNNRDKDLEGYGLKEIMGVRRLAGEGLETKDVPGMQHGGGRWPFRLQDMCVEYVEAVDEMFLYRRFLKKKSIENALCRNIKSELGPICPKKKRRVKKKKKNTEEETTPDNTTEEPGEASEEPKEEGEGTEQPEEGGQPKEGDEEVTEQVHQPEEEAGTPSQESKEPEPKTESEKEGKGSADEAKVDSHQTGEQEQRPPREENPQDELKEGDAKQTTGGKADNSRPEGSGPKDEL